MFTRYACILRNVIRSFADESTADVYYGLETKRARRLPKKLWPAIRRKLDALHRARSLKDLQLPAGNRLEKLQGRRAETYSMRVNDQYRITFRMEGANAYDVACEDYH